MKPRPKLKGILADAAALILGCGAIAVGFVCFTIPNNIAPGGVSGLATAISYLTNAPIGLLTLVLNLPLLVIAWRMFGLRPLLRTIVGTLTLSLFLDLFAAVPFVYTNNVLLAAVMAGVCIGAGLGLLFIRNFTTGGTDLIAMIVRKHMPHIPMGQLLMAVDIMVVVIAVCIFRNIEIALYSGVTIFCTSKVMDTIMQGVDYAKVLFVVTEHEQRVVSALMEHVARGVTLLPARGGYTGKAKGVLMMAVRRREVPTVVKVIKQADPRSFTILTNATEVRGEGFKEE